MSRFRASSCSEMRLQGYVRVTNNSGEDYENAQTRLIVGKVHIIDRIADLARRKYPYGTPMEGIEREGLRLAGAAAREVKRAFAPTQAVDMLAAPKAIKKEGLSEYFLYTIEGTENGPSRRAKSANSQFRRLIR